MTRLRGLVLASAFVLSPSLRAQFTFAIATNSLPNGSIGKGYSVSLDSNGDSSTTWSISAGKLPTGLFLNGQGKSAIVSGTPSAGGTFTFTIKASDANAQQTASLAYTIGIIQITTPSPLPDAMALTAYSMKISASDGVPAYAFSLVLNAGDTFPPDLSLNAQTGVISGTPSATSTGTFKFSVRATDSEGNQATSPFTLTILAPLQITTPSPLPNGFAAIPYSQTINTTGGLPPYIYALVGVAPAGLTLSSTGVVGGTPNQNGSFNLTVKVTDKDQFTLTKQFQITITAAGPLLQVSPLQLSFVAFTGGDAPPPQTIKITTTGTANVPFAISLDGGTPNSKTPTWLSVTPSQGTAPCTLLVRVNPSGLAFGGAPLPAGIHITVPGMGSAIPVINVSISLSVNFSATRLLVTPPSLQFNGSAQSPATSEQAIVVDNTGGSGTLSFTAASVLHSPWIMGVTPGSGQATPNTPALVRVDVNTQGLSPGSYHDIVRIVTPAGSTDVPVRLFVTAQGAVLKLNQAGVLFTVRQGQGTSLRKPVKVLNAGDLGSTVNWTADLVSGSDWLALAATQGSATLSTPGTLTLVPAASIASLPAVPRYALVRVIDSLAQNSPQYLTAVLDVEPAATLPEPQPSSEGLYFTNLLGTPAAQTINVYTSSSTATGFQVAASTSDGANWLTAAITAPNASSQTPGGISVSVNAAPLAAGVYSGSINISMGAVLRTVNVTLIIVPGLPVSAQFQSSLQPQAAGGCAPTKIVITPLGLLNNFSVLDTWPETIAVQLTDECGNAVTNANVVANFSNGDPSITLAGDRQTGVYTATWPPSAAAAQVVATVRATSPSLLTATAQWIGAVNQNPNDPPMLVPNGALHIFFNAATAALLGGGLAPGSVAQVYGTGLSPSAAPTGTVPLQTDFNGTFMLIGAAKAPLFYVSGPLVDVQVPVELTPNRQYPLIVSSNGALTLPQTVDVVPLTPGVAQYSDGATIAQHIDYSLINTSNPAKPGEQIIIYLAGMGATDPVVASGAPAPAALVPVKTPAVVTVDGQGTDILYAGLTPTGIGLYQIIFTVPAKARSGSLDLVVNQAGILSNTTKLPVSVQ